MPAATADGLKVCTRCKHNKPVDAFNIHKLAKDGLRTWCRECCAERERLNGDSRVGPRKKVAPVRFDTDWMKRAACRWEDPEMWFPAGNTGAALLQAEAAKFICRRRCPELERCRDWALTTNQEHGVLGGMSEEERKAHKRRLSRARTA
jgi:WhiB family transcriptional regulator, redox-sensing transcriptional regulator